MGYYAEEGSATEYAADRVSAASERITNEGVHQFNKQGQKAVSYTHLKTLKTLFKQDKEKFVIPKSVQAMIPIKTIWEDGIFPVSYTHLYSLVQKSGCSKEAFLRGMVKGYRQAAHNHYTCLLYTSRCV